MIKRFKTKHDSKRFYRINERIFAHTLRVLGSDGKQIGILSKFEALKKARELDLDLVEIAPNAQPPVAKLIDFNKFLYQEEKKKKEEKKKAKSSGTKELRLGPFMDNHDLQVIIKKAKEFLQENNKVKLVVKFKGRQIQHPEFGENIIDKVTEALSSISKIEKERHFEGRQLIGILSPERKKDVKEKNQEINK
ncbi:MAG: translation initiation factor IF-3 [Candidatus Levybacteria bacterium]|nr:translation initiation factor IF-3 [Candidatus Levybacteria bacterium]